VPADTSALLSLLTSTISATTEAIWPLPATIEAIDQRDSPGVTTTCTYLLSLLTAVASLLSLAAEMVLKPAPITTNSDTDKTVLANRFACLAFIFFS